MSNRFYSIELLFQLFIVNSASIGFLLILCASNFDLKFTIMTTQQEQSSKRRNVLKTGLLALGSLAVFPQFVSAKKTGAKEEKNKAIVGEWFTHFWGKT